MAYINRPKEEMKDAKPAIGITILPKGIDRPITALNNNHKGVIDVNNNKPKKNIAVYLVFVLKNNIPALITGMSARRYWP